MNIERAMARIAKIDDVIKHPNADSLDICTIGGWKVVTRLNEFQKGEMVVFCEIDSWIPTELAPFLSKGKEPREYNGIKGERLRIAKLRNQISQGLILPLSPTCDMIVSQLFEGLDVSYPLGIQKYEAPIPACLAGAVKGNFPSRIPKTDQERIQNLTKEFEVWKQQDIKFEKSEKLDGSSMTCYIIDDEFGVCSRNLDLKYDTNNSFWKAAIKYNIEENLRKCNRNIAIQGELYGSGINGNIYKLTDHRYNIFDIYDIDAGRYLTSWERLNFIKEYGLPESVPILNDNFSLQDYTVESLLIDADGKSSVNPDVLREGIVYKCITDPDISFKAISNQFLLGEK